jgi:hypothetical protein
MNLEDFSKEHSARKVSKDRVMDQRRLVKELCPKGESCVAILFVCDGETHYDKRVYLNVITGKAVVARKLRNWWVVKLAEGETQAEAIMRWKARNDPPSLF